MMCGLSINADADLWESKNRSMRIEGVVTSIRMETFFWNILQEIACRDEMTVNQLVTKLYLESLDADHDVGNFTSFLRVCCGRYLSLSADGHLQRDEAKPLAGLASAKLIEKETEAANLRQLNAANRRGESH